MMVLLVAMRMMVLVVVVGVVVPVVVLVVVVVVVVVVVAVLVVVVVMMVPVVVLVVMVVVVVVVMMVFLEMHVELRPGDPCLLAARRVNMETLEAEPAQLPLEFGQVNPQVEQRANEHIAADAADQVQVKRLHARPTARALI
jgi:energy-coupling factor transporter transmembrane protein EcfT